MPVAPTYPGVYIEEIPSGVRTIVGVATSVTAFVGRAVAGPTDKPIVINGFADYERIFGGLSLDSTMSYAVRDFFLNGGAQAIIVRLYHRDAAGTLPEKTPLTVGGLTLQAAHPGTWGENLRVSVSTDVSPEAAAALGIPAAQLFHLTVRDVSPGGRVEQYRNLTLLTDSPRRVDLVLKAESDLVEWSTPPPPAPGTAVTADDDAVTKAEKELQVVRRTNGINSPAVQTALDAVRTAKESLRASPGLALTQVDDFTPTGGEVSKKGIFALEDADIFNILCIPPYLPDDNVDQELVGLAAAYCERRRAMLLVDPPSAWDTKENARDGLPTIGTTSKNAALFFPRLRQRDLLRNNQLGDFVPCGAVAGIFARTDTQRGVWKAPAGLEATLVAVRELKVKLTDEENGELNPLGINCLRARPAVGPVVWGSRTLQGNDRLASEWKYIPVRRTALFIEESLYRGTQWVVFEPNDEPLWAQIRLNVGAFMHNLFRQGAFQGRTPREAYFVKCDKETTTQNDINLGIVNVVVGFAPLKPAEFVIIKIQQMAGEIQT
jgi:phage tail sheath protein FI